MIDVFNKKNKDKGSKNILIGQPIITTILKLYILKKKRTFAFINQAP